MSNRAIGIKRMTGGLAIVTLAGLAGCDARSLAGDASATGSAGSAGSATAGTTGTGGTGGNDAGPPPTCPATCDTPAGTVYPFARVEEIYAAMEGPWQFCARTGSTYPGPADIIGVEYGPASTAPTAGGSTVGGDMYYLVAGPNGPVRGAGFSYQLTYDISPAGAGPWQLNMHPAPNSGFGASVRYSPCPRELEMVSLSVSGQAILVPF